MISTHYQAPGTGDGEAACGRHKHRRASSVTGVRTSPSPRDVDCGRCQRHEDVKAYRAQVAIERAQRVDIENAWKGRLVPGARVFGYGAHGTVELRFGERVVRWDDGNGFADLSTDNADRFEVVS